MDSRILVVAFFLIFMAYNDRFVAGVLIKFTNAYCKSYNESLFKINLCRIRAVNRYKNTFNYNATVFHPIYDVKARLQVFKRANGYKPFLYDISDIDVCQYLRKPSNPILMLIVKQFRNFTNLLDQKCPVTGTKTVKGVYLDSNNINLPIPAGEYMFASSWVLNEKYIGIVNISGQVVEDLN